MFSMTAATNSVGKFFAANKPNPADVKDMKSFLIIVGTYVGIYWFLRIFGITTEFHTELFGIPVEISMLTGLLWMIFVNDSIIYIRKHHIGVAGHSYFIAGAIIAVIMALSVVFHEISHGLAAMATGYPVDHAGISWWGAFVGWHTNGDMNPVSQIFISLAGPVSNLLIALVAGWLVMIFKESLFENTIQYLCVANLRLGMFNLIPFPILDGGHTVTGIIGLFTENDQAKLIISLVIFALFMVWRRYFSRMLTRIEEILAIA